VLFRDPWFGHRSWITWDAVGSQADWTDWDYAIATAMQMIEDGTTEEGLLIWEVSQEDVFVDPEKRFNKARQAIEDITSADNYKSKNGEYWVPILRQHGVEPGHEVFQTRREWIEKTVENSDHLD
jgi:hypothetical protein